MRTYEENHELNLTLPTPYGRTRAHMREERPVEYLTVDSRVKFFNDRRWWAVRALDEHHVVLTRTADFGRSIPYYTIISWDEGRRGPHDSWNYGTLTDEECQETLKAMTSGEIQLSERQAIYLDIKEIQYDND